MAKKQIYNKKLLKSSMGLSRVVVAATVLIILCVMWYFIAPSLVTIEVSEKAPDISETLENGFKRESLGIISTANLIPEAHEVKGTVSLIEDLDGRIFLRFENFEIINGPDTRVYLSKDFEKGDSVELGALKATHGDFNYEVPLEVHLEEYSKVLIWSDTFDLLFAYADFAK